MRSAFCSGIWNLYFQRKKFVQRKEADKLRSLEKFAHLQFKDEQNCKNGPVNLAVTEGGKGTCGSK